MPNSTDIQIAEYLQKHRQGIETLLHDAFVWHAIDNRGMLASARQGPQVAAQLVELVVDFTTGNAGEKEVAATAEALAGQGLALITGSHMMRSLGEVSWLETAEISLKKTLTHRLTNFQLLFLEKLAEARERVQHRVQERSQQALQQALHTQLEKQRQLRLSQEQRNQNFSRILQLNAQLARISSEKALLDEAVSGICRALDLADVTFYELRLPQKRWTIRTTTASGIKPGGVIAPGVIKQLDSALAGDGELITHHAAAEGKERLSVAIILRGGDKVMGAMGANSNELQSGQRTEFPILLRTFAQNLAALWHNLHLFTETRQRTRELEILHGRYVDSLWTTESTTLSATYRQHDLQIDRQPDTPYPLPQDSDHAIPLLMENRLFGHVILPENVQLTPAEKEFAQALIYEMGNALNKAYLLQTTRAYSNQLSLATKVSSAATTILDRDLLIQEVVELIGARFNFYYVGLFLVDEKNETAVLQAGTGEAGRLQVKQKHSHVIGGSSMIGTAIATGQALVEQDVSQAKAFSFNELLPDTRSELALPLRTRGRTIGALTVQSTKQGDFTESTVNVLQSLADQLAIAIENAGLFAQTQETLAETNRLYETSRKISEASSQDEIYEALLEFARLSNIVDAARTLAIDPSDPNHVFSSAQWGPIQLQSSSNKHYERSNLPFSEELEADQTVIIKDTQTDTRLNPMAHEFYGQNGIRSAAIIPILTESGLLGSVSLYRTTADAFTAQELQPFHTLVDQAAIALANQQLFEEIRAANKKLRQLDQLKNQFLANMSHELRTPLNSIIGFSRVILKGIDGPITPEQEEDLTSIYNNGQHLLTLINEILDMAKIDAGKMTLTFEPVNLEEIARNAFSTVRSLVEEDKVELIWDVASNLPLLEADPVRLRQILNNLLSNAAKYTEEGHIRLEINQVGENQVHITVHDTGIGIDPEEFEILFKAFEQIDNSTTRTAGGTGLGLPITKWIVETHQGEIWAESAVNKGTDFHVTLPIKRTDEDAGEITFDESQTILESTPTEQKS